MSLRQVLDDYTLPALWVQIFTLLSGSHKYQDRLFHLCITMLMIKNVVYLQLEMSEKYLAQRKYSVNVSCCYDISSSIFHYLCSTCDN